MSYKIIQKGNQHTNSSSRDGHIPYVIVDHISAGSMGSMDNWFTSSGNKVSSAHFGVSKNGEIHQYVPIERMAWANGLKQWEQQKATAEVVRNNPTLNPNKYTVSIEHEGTDGQLTEAQFAATVWLHKHIQSEVKRLYGRDMLLDSYHVIGHFQVDPKRKPNCPGPKFPWDRLYKVLKEEKKVTTERDINKVSAWAETTWKEAQDNGYFDGTRPGAPITREEAAAVMNRMRKNFLKLIGGNSDKIAELEKRLIKIEKEEMNNE